MKILFPSHAIRSQVFYHGIHCTILDGLMRGQIQEEKCKIVVEDTVLCRLPNAQQYQVNDFCYYNFGGQVVIRAFAIKAA